MSKICLCFGGPSDERNISAGSIKPWVTWLQATAGLELTVLFFDRATRPWRLPEAYYFTNTCEDFEASLAPDDSLDQGGLDELLREQDVVVPLIHGSFGEDGELQSRLESLGVPYVFSAPQALALTFDKQATYGCLREEGFDVPEHFAIDRDSWRDDPHSCFQRARQFETSQPGLACAVKPNRGGSSIGVSLVADDETAFTEAVELAFVQDDLVLVEAPLAGVEYSVVVLETADGAIALAPTEVELTSELYDTRSKYLHGSGARLHTPLRDISLESELREAVLRAWRATGLRDMARIDAFRTPDGRLIVTDINGISGMGFSSFGFLQTSLAGLGHGELIAHLLDRAAARAERSLPPIGVMQRSAERVHVLFGGPTSERQVSRQSGIFVGLALMARGFDVRFHFMDQACQFTEVGLFYALHHDVEEISELVAAPERRTQIDEVGRRIARQLQASSKDDGQAGNRFVGPTTDLPQAVAQADFVFLALHGGPGEDGRMQAALEVLGKAYNGCGAISSQLCSDKVAALACLRAASLDGVGVPRQQEVTLTELSSWFREPAWSERFEELQEALGSRRVVLKPASDGCSTGVKLLSGPGELKAFVHAILSMRRELAPDELAPGSRSLQLPVPPPDRWVFEQALVDDDGPELPEGDWNANNLRAWWDGTRYVEITCALCEVPGRGLVAATPSLTVARAAELSLEEKFQQGVGSNLELDAFLGEETLSSLRDRIARVAQSLGIEGYARLDCFYDRQEGQLLLLEANTLCALTEATVFYTQMHSSFGASPPEALEWILRAGMRARVQV